MFLTYFYFFRDFSTLKHAFRIVNLSTIISITSQVAIIRPKRLRSRNFENHAAYDVEEAATADPGH